jgi:hypothetical protein
MADTFPDFKLADVAALPAASEAGALKTELLDFEIPPLL